MLLSIGLGFLSTWLSSWFPSLRNEPWASVVVDTSEGIVCLIFGLIAPLRGVYISSSVRHWKLFPVVGIEHWVHDYFCWRDVVLLSV